MIKIRFKRLLFSLVFFPMFVLVMYPANLEPQIQISQTNQIVKSLDNLPAYFVENNGQLSKEIKYQLKMRDKNIYFFSKGILFQFLHYQRKHEGNTREKRLTRLKKKDEKIIKVENIWMKFVEANEKVTVEGLDESEAAFSYFRGSNPKKWVKGARTYHKILYKNLYPHIDLIVSLSRGRIKYHYRKKKGGEIKDIKTRYEGIKQLTMNERGQLEIETAQGVLKVDSPLSDQMVDGQRVEVETIYEIDKDNTVSFNVGKYKRDREIAIRSTESVNWNFPLVYSTYLGGSDDDWGWSVPLFIDKGYEIFCGFDND